MKLHPVFDADAKKLGLTRIIVFGIWTIIILSTPFINFAALPSDLFEPVGIYKILLPANSYLLTHIILTEPFLLGLKWLSVIGCLLCVIGFRPFKWVAIPTILLLFLCDGIVRGFNGFVNHAELAVLFSALILTFSPACDAFSIDKEPIPERSKTNYPIALLLIALLFCLAYSFIGVNRISHGGIDIFKGDALLNYLGVNTFKYSKFSFKIGTYVLENILLLYFFKVGFAAITVFEISTPFILVNQPFRTLWLWVIIPFHLLSLLTMNIFFWENTLLLLILLSLQLLKKPPLKREALI